MRSFVTTSTRRNISFACFCHNQSIPEWALTLISPLEIDISSSLFDIFKMSSRFAEYIVLALNEKLITGIIEFFLLFNVILSRGHREPSLFTHAWARATMRQKKKQNLDPGHCMIYVFGRSVRMERTTSVVFIFTHYCMTLSALLHTEFIRLNALTFIKFFVNFYSRAAFIRGRYI